MDLNEATEPFALFESWLAEARATEPNNAEAMTVATVTANETPAARMVLLRGFDRRGFVFYTNLESAKATDLTARPNAALCFYWKATQRQVRIEGSVIQVDDAEADAYFASRPRGSRIGAWSSEQSRPLDKRATLEARVAETEARYEGVPVPRPPFWSGFLVAPRRIEFWQEQPFRLHDRIVFKADGDGWARERLYP